jgi:ABC-type sugar transport system ATPase subunit
VRPRDLLGRVAFVTEDRHHDGLFLSLPNWQNVTAAATRRFAGPAGVMRVREERAAADSMVERLQIKLGRLDDPVSSLSGGNQQKVVLGRWLVRAADIYLLDEPTHGVDVGAKAQIHDVIHEVADRGASVVVISSEVEEIFALADRILVLRDGAFVEEFARRDFDQQTLLAAS